MKCQAKTKAGKPCRAAAVSNSKYCMIHAPHLGAKRAQARKRGGQSHRVNHGDIAMPAQLRTRDDELQLLDYTLAELAQHDNTLLRVEKLIRLIQASARLREVGELESRLEAIEQALKAR